MESRKSRKERISCLDLNPGDEFLVIPGKSERPVLVTLFRLYENLDNPKESNLEFKSTGSKYSVNISYEGYLYMRLSGNIRKKSIWKEKEKIGRWKKLLEKIKSIKNFFI